MNKLLKVLSVYRYEKSGRLVAWDPTTGTAIPLNGDLTHSDRESHRINRKTEISQTSYRIEYEYREEQGAGKYKRLRAWDVNHLPQKSTDHSAPLENRIDITPSDLFNDAENKYVGRSSGHPVAGWIGGLSVFPLVFWVIPVTCISLIDSRPTPPVVSTVFLIILGSCLFGILVSYIISACTRSSGDPQKIQEVNEAKVRVRTILEKRIADAMRDIHAWDRFDGIEFERAVGGIYKEQGFDVEFTPRTNDQGIDLILRKQNSVSIVQCKAYANNVGVAAVRELVGVRAAWPDANEVILVSLYDFSNPAKEFAAKHNVKLFSIAKDYLKTDYRPFR